MEKVNKKELVAKIMDAKIMDAKILSVKIVFKYKKTRKLISEIPIFSELGSKSADAQIPI